MKLFLTMLFLFFGTSVAFSAGTFYSVDAELQSAHELIDNEKYQQAIEILNGAIESEPANADAWNLLGYASRKEGKLELSSEAYEKALSIDPNHKDALEYQGELFLMLDDMAAAKNNLAKLGSLCPESCEQLEMLMEAIAEQE